MMNEVLPWETWPALHPAVWGLALCVLGLGIALLIRQRLRYRALQALLHEQEFNVERLEMALEASGAAQWECDIANNRYALSDRYYTQLGYRPGSFPATMASWRDMVHPDDAAMVSERIGRALKPQSDEDFVCEYRMRDAWGQWHWLLSQGRVLRRGPAGEALLMMGTHHDIHEVKCRRDAQQESQARFQKIYEATPDAVGITSVATREYIDINPGYERVFGFSREQVIGKTVVELGIWPDASQRERFWEEFNRTGQVDLMEADGRRSDGRMIVVLLSVRTLIERGELCHLFIVRDITGWRRLQQEADAARAQVAAAAAASQAKTEFLSRMSHELRTPLNAVLGFAQLLRDAPALAAADAERGRVDAILQAGWHLLTLIDEVLDIARIESGHIHIDVQPLRLRPLIEEAVDLLRPQAREMDVSLEFADLVATDCLVMGDALRLRQALVNLLSNAVKYNRRGGKVRLDGIVENGRYVLSIADTGCGMSARQMEHLFEPFNRLGRERDSIEGTGIGLVLTREFLRLMGAGLRLQSQPGEGTTACVDLTLAAALEAGSLAEGAMDAPDALPQARVLYIEDSLTNQQLVQATLAPWPQLTLVLAGNGGEGLRLAAELQPDLLLLDMRLPDMDGLDVLAALRADPALAHLKVVALSASAMPDEIEQAKASGAMEYWTKPMQLDRFVDDLRRVLRAAPKAGPAPAQTATAPRTRESR